MPRHITYIEGYNSNTGRMYFGDSEGKATLSSNDGYKFELTEKVPTGTTAAYSIPGIPRDQTVAQNVGDYTGTT